MCVCMCEWEREKQQNYLMYKDVMFKEIILTDDQKLHVKILYLIFFHTNHFASFIFITSFSTTKYLEILLWHLLLWNDYLTLTNVCQNISEKHVQNRHSDDDDDMLNLAADGKLENNKIMLHTLTVREIQL